MKLKVVLPDIVACLLQHTVHLVPDLRVVGDLHVCIPVLVLPDLKLTALMLWQVAPRLKLHEHC